MSVVDALSPNSKRSIRLSLPSLIPKALGFAVSLPFRCAEQVPILGKAGIAAALQYHVIPISVTLYTLSVLVKRARRKPAEPLPTEADEEILDMVKGLDSTAAAAQLESVRVKMLEAMVDNLLKSMLEDSLASTLALPFTKVDIDLIRSEMQLRLSTLQTLYGQDVVDLLLEKLEKQKNWTKAISDQAAGTDINNPRLNFPQPKVLQDPQQWASHTQLRE